MDFKDKVIWITGASSGIGEHLAYGFAELGANLILSSRNEKELERVRLNCRGDSRVHILPFDIRDYERLPDLAGQVVGTFGFVNILINNAGVSQRARAVETLFDVDRQMLDVNFLGPVALTKAMAPFFIRQQFGHIVVISSILGKVGVPGRTAYAASKHALHGFFDSLRAELHEENIPVTLICPGYVNTNLPINALRGDGSPNNQPDEGRAGLEPSVFAQKAIRAIARRRKEVYIGGALELLAVYLMRVWPGLFFRLVRRYKSP